MKPSKRAALYAALLFAILLAQNTFLSKLSLFGVRAFIVPIAAVACGFFEDGVWGGFYGLAAGYLCDLAYHENTALFLVVFTLIGFFSGMSSHFFVNGKLLPFVFLSAAALLFTAACQMLRPVVFLDADFFSAASVALMQSLISLPFAFVIYLPFRAVKTRR